MCMKICKKCKIEKDILDFPKNGKYIRSTCKLCTNEKMKEWKYINDEYMKTYLKNYREENKIEINKKKKINYEQNKEKYLKQKKEYYQNNKEKIIKRVIKYTADREKIDIIFLLSNRVRTLIRNAFKRKFTEKSEKTINILGCTFEDFKPYIEKQFDNIMSWDNYGIYWEIDHIIPIASAKTEDDILKLNHYTNLRPLNITENKQKGSKIIELI